MIYSLTKNKEETVGLNPNDFCLRKYLDLKLGLDYEYQIDGREWSLKDVDEKTTQLIEEITANLKKEVSKFVHSVNPYAGWLNSKDYKLQNHFFESIKNKDEIFANTEWEDMCSPESGCCLSRRSIEVEFEGEKYILNEGCSAGSYISGISIKHNDCWVIKNHRVENLYARSACFKTTEYREPNTKLYKNGRVIKEEK